MAGKAAKMKENAKARASAAKAVVRSAKPKAKASSKRTAMKAVKTAKARKPGRGAQAQKVGKAEKASRGLKRKADSKSKPRGQVDAKRRSPAPAQKRKGAAEGRFVPPAKAAKSSMARVTKRMVMEQDTCMEAADAKTQSASVDSLQTPTPVKTSSADTPQTTPGAKKQPGIKQVRLAARGKRQPGVWGPFWSRDQCKQSPEQDGETSPGQESSPSNWPEGVVPSEGKKVYWLPEGWSQGIKTTAGGKTLKVFLNEEGKIFYHKTDVETALQVKLPEKKGVKAVPVELDVHTARPSWPEGEWLPRDWFICFKKLPNRLHKCYVTPDQTGYAYHRFNVLDYLSGKTNKLTSVDRRMLKAKDSAAKRLNLEDRS